MPLGYPGSTPGVNPRSQGVIPRRFKRKKNFVTDGRTNGLTNRRKDGRTDRRDGRNSDLDVSKKSCYYSHIFSFAQNLINYFGRHVCPSFRPFVRPFVTIFFA